MQSYRRKNALRSTRTSFLAALMLCILFIGWSVYASAASSSVEIDDPNDGDEVTGGIVVKGTASGLPAGNSSKVTVKIDDGNWQEVDEKKINGGKYTWVWGWESAYASNGEHTIHARAYDGTEWSESVSIEITTNNTVRKTGESDDEKFEIAGMNGYILLGGAGAIVLCIVMTAVALKGRKTKRKSSGVTARDGTAQYSAQPPQPQQPQKQPPSQAALQPSAPQAPGYQQPQPQQQVPPRQQQQQYSQQPAAQPQQQVPPKQQPQQQYTQQQAQQPAAQSHASQAPSFQQPQPQRQAPTPQPQQQVPIQVAAPQQAAAWQCAKCGSTMEANYRFCTGCGTKKPGE